MPSVIRLAPEHTSVIQKVPELHVGTSRNRETTESSQTGQLHTYCERRKCKVENMINVRNDITCAMNCDYGIAASLYILESGFISGTGL
jgi:hypothetical protein